MKLTKLMLSACVAALALVSCNKQDTTPVVSKNLKSVEISLSNVIFATKSEGIDTDLTNTKLQLNSVQFFFTDGTSIYTPMQADGVTPAKTYFTAEELGTADLSFHYLSSWTNRVIAVGNKPMITASKVTDITTALDINNEQDYTKLSLYDDAEIVVKADANHNTGENAHNTVVYEVDLDLVPRVARLEIKGVSCNFSTPSPYSSLSINKFAFVDYFQHCDLRQNTKSDVRSVDGNQTAVFNHFASLSGDLWHYDNFYDTATSTSSVVLTPTAPADTDVNLAYHFFPGTGAYPRVLVDVTADTTPSYLATVSFKKNDGTTLTAADFQPGYIYRMNFAFSDTDLEHQDKCVEITVDVASWQIYTVTPVF